MGGVNIKVAYRDIIEEGLLFDRLLLLFSNHMKFDSVLEVSLSVHDMELNHLHGNILSLFTG